MRRAFVVPGLAAAVLAIGAPLASACGDDRAAAADLVMSDAPRAQAEAAAAPGAAAALAGFATDLYAILAREDGNIVFSPYSAVVALAMTRAGAAGETLEQMDAVLRATEAGDLDAGLNAIDQALAQRPGRYQWGDRTVELELAMANQLWGQRDFEFHAAFLDRLAAQYGAGMRLVDYERAREDARKAINDWVAEQTKGRIPEIIGPGDLTVQTRLVLTNAIYLNAPWEHRFEKDATAPATFTRLDGSTVEAQMMRLSEALRYARGDGYQAVELPYVDGSLAMLVIVPDAGEFAAFETGLDAGTIDRVVDSLTIAQVRLGFPKFEFRLRSGLKEPLSEMGMPIAFDPDAADFSAMSPAGMDMFIQDVLHEAFIAVDEDGTEAAAATAVIAGITSMPGEIVDLDVDRPFIFLIRDNETGAILFLGRVLDPAR
jgi:serpin B